MALILGHDWRMGQHYDLLKEMFDRMVVPRNAALIEVYYHPDFRMQTNQIEQGYEDFRADHQKYYAQDSGKSYRVEYDDETVVEDANGVACRVWITTQQGAGDPTRIEVVLIAKYRDGQIHRLWELTLPNWSTLDGFKS